MTESAPTHVQPLSHSCREFVSQYSATWPVVMLMNILLAAIASVLFFAPPSSFLLILSGVVLLLGYTISLETILSKTRSESGASLEALCPAASAR